MSDFYNEEIGEIQREIDTKQNKYSEQVADAVKQLSAELVTKYSFLPEAALFNIEVGWVHLIVRMLDEVKSVIGEHKFSYFCMQTISNRLAYSALPDSAWVGKEGIAIYTSAENVLNEYVSLSTITCAVCGCTTEQKPSMRGIPTCKEHEGYLGKRAELLRAEEPEFLDRANAEIKRISDVKGATWYKPNPSRLEMARKARESDAGLDDLVADESGQGDFTEEELIEQERLNAEFMAQYDAQHSGKVITNGKRKKHKLYSVADVTRMLDEVDADTPDRGQRERRKAILNNCLKMGEYRHYATIPDDMCEKLEEKFPNFKPMFERVKMDIAISKGTGQLRIRPILLLGSQGIGKTTVAYAIAEAIGSECVITDFSKQNTASSLSGSEAYWGNSATGSLFNTLTKHKCANPVFVLDEVDKAVIGINHTSPIASLYSLLEEKSAKKFQDLSIPLTIDASKVIFILTANSLDGLDKALLSRMTVINIEPPTKEESAVIATNIYLEIISQFAEHEFPIELDEDVLDMISDQPPRLQKGILEDACARVLMDGRSNIEVRDLQVKKATEKRSIGFMTN